MDITPLLPAQAIAGGTHDVLYVVTEHNTIYGLDAQTGQVLVTRNLGPPVPTPRAPTLISGSVRLSSPLRMVRLVRVTG